MLSVLDGHTLEEGIIFVMTTNYVEKLDPALTRPGTTFMCVTLILLYNTHAMLDLRSHGLALAIEVCHTSSDTAHLQPGGRWGPRRRLSRL